MCARVRCACINVVCVAGKRRKMIQCRKDAKKGLRNACT